MIEAEVQRHLAGAPRELTVVAHGLDPAGIPRDLARETVTSSIPESCAERHVFDLPPELRNRITRFEVAGERSAGAVTLTDDALQRREVALIDAQGDDEGQALLSPLHYLRQALAPTADLMEGGLSNMLLASPDAMILADIATLSPDEEAALIAWVERGGLLVRFAGPRLAASDAARYRRSADARAAARGRRSMGGAMSWGEPKAPCPVRSETGPSSASPCPAMSRSKARSWPSPIPSCRSAPSRR
jgi:hypothetical protein